MKMCGIRIRLIFLVSMLISTQLMGQDCTLPACADTECDDVNVGFSPGGGNQFCENTPITFDNTSTTTDFDFFYIDWSDGDIDTIYDYNDVTNTYFIPDSALCDFPNGKILFKVCFQGIKECNEGISCSSGSYDFALLLRPKAVISGPSQACVDEPVVLSNTGCHADTYLWEFEGHPPSTEVNPTISYSTPGTYSVTLTVENECGIDVDSYTISILGLPESEVSVSAEAEDCIICLGTDVTFTDLSNEWSTNTTWNITPGGTNNWEYTDTLMNNNSDVITVEFKDIQTYTVQLTASNICGEDVWEKDIEVLDGPTIDLEDGPRYCENGNYTPEVTYTGTIESYKWTFEGGIPMMSTESNPTNIAYNTVGEFTVTLMVNGGCGPLTTTTTIIVDELLHT